MVTVPKDSGADKKRLWVLLSGIFLVSFSLLAFEITLTRLLSVILLYHYVFIIVSLALLGLGAGGIFVHLFRPRAGERQILRALTAVSLTSLSIPLSVILMVQSSYVDFLRSTLFLFCLALFIPFFFAGMLFSEMFRAFPELSARLYGADLIGAAGGSLGVIFLIDMLGGITASFLLGVIVSIAALLFAVVWLRRKLRRARVVIGSLLVTVVLLGANLSGAFLPEVPIAGTNPDKEISVALTEASYQGKIRESRWSTFGRTDLVEFPQRPEQMNLYIDGTAGTPMYRFSGNLNTLDSELGRLKTTFTGYFPFFFLSPAEKNSALLIGPGGGRDIVLALMAGVEKITAVEVNRDIVDIVRDYSWYNGGIMSRFDNVTVVVDEGRNFLKRQREEYDLIMLSLPVTQTSRSLEGFSLTENFLFTTESIHDYLDHLTEEGQLIVVSHDDFTVWKLLAISLAALEEKGDRPETAMAQMYLLGLSTPGTYPLFVLSKTPLSSEEVSVRHEKMLELGYNPSNSFFPHIEAGGGINPVLLALSRGEANINEIRQHFMRTLNIDIGAATDNSPFFYKIDVGLPFSVSLVLWLSAVMMALVLLLPFMLRKRRSSPTNVRTTTKKATAHLPTQAVLLFAMLGIGFMLIEISLIQKFVLFLGQPVLSLAFVLFSMLVGCGLGSVYSGRFAENRLTQRITLSAMIVALILVIYAFLLPLVFQGLLGLALSLRLLTAIVLLLPLGFFMGQPFPLGIRWVKQLNMESQIPWLWGINGVGSVLGSVATIAIAISAGFTQALVAGASCYLVAWLAFRVGKKQG